jgi:hypothetical protein
MTAVVAQWITLETLAQHILKQLLVFMLELVLLLKNFMVRCFQMLKVHCGLEA